MKEIISAIIAGLGLLTGLKKKPYKLLLWNPTLKRWERTHDGPMSHRNCRKLLAVLVAPAGPGGLQTRRFVIVRNSAHEADIPEPKEPGK